MKISINKIVVKVVLYCTAILQEFQQSVVNGYSDHVFHTFALIKKPMKAKLFSYRSCIFFSGLVSGKNFMRILKVQQIQNLFLFYVLILNFIAMKNI